MVEQNLLHLFVKKEILNWLSCKTFVIMETFHFQFNLNYNYKSHYDKVICYWLAWFYKRKL